MEEKLGRESAFPSKNYSISVPTDKFSYGEQEFKMKDVLQSGISKRFYAACIAMQGIISNSLIVESLSKNKNTSETTLEIIKMAYECSDELLKQENQ